MNMLLFEQDEVDGNGVFRVTGERAEHIVGVLKLNVGESLRVGMLGVGIGRGRIESLARDSVLIRPGPLEADEPLPPRSLLVALPRPQSVKKILQSAATFGVERVVFIASERTEKSYFSSTVLRAAELRQHLRLGLEQGVSARAPEVLVLSERKPRKSPGFAQWLGELFPAARRLIAHVPGEGETVPPLSAALDAVTRVVFAVGPEGGWTGAETEAFIQSGFQPFRLSPRVLRVETAAGAALAQHDLIRMSAEGKERGER